LTGTYLAGRYKTVKFRRIGARFFEALTQSKINYIATQKEIDKICAVHIFDSDHSEAAFGGTEFASQT